MSHTGTATEKPSDTAKTPITPACPGESPEAVLAEAKLAIAVHDDPRLAACFHPSVREQGMLRGFRKTMATAGCSESREE